MFRRKRRFQNDTAYMIAGAAVGGLVALLYAPKSGTELRKDIKNEVDTAVNQVRQRAVDMSNSASRTATDLINRAGEILSLSRNYVGGSYQTTANSILNEITSLRRAFNSAVETYKTYKEQTSSPQIHKRTDEVFTSANTEFNDENLPKFEGMGRRQE